MVKKFYLIFNIIQIFLTDHSLNLNSKVHIHLSIKVNYCIKMETYRNSIVPCIKCSTSKNIGSYVHGERITTSERRYIKVSSRVASLPVCENCQEIFKQWVRNNYSITEKSSYTDYAWGFGCGLIIAIGTAFNYLWFSLIIFAIMGLALLWILHDRFKKRNENSPFRYAKFKYPEKVYVKPGGTGDWIPFNTWLSQYGVNRDNWDNQLKAKNVKPRAEEFIDFALQREQIAFYQPTTIACPRCGTVHRKEARFCTNCGAPFYSY